MRRCDAISDSRCVVCPILTRCFCFICIFFWSVFPMIENKNKPYINCVVTLEECLVAKQLRPKTDLFIWRPPSRSTPLPFFSLAHSLAHTIPIFLIIYNNIQLLCYHIKKYWKKYFCVPYGKGVVGVCNQWKFKEYKYLNIQRLEDTNYNLYLI